MDSSNPSGAARRKLLRKVRIGGGVALGAIIAKGWHTPVVQSAILPAHAQSSGNLGSPPVANSCPVIVNVIHTDDFQNQDSYSFQGAIGSIGFFPPALVSGTGFTGGSSVASGSATFDPVGYVFDLVHTPAFSSVASATYSLTISCCNDSLVTNFVATGVQTFPFNVNIMGGGVCSIT